MPEMWSLGVAVDEPSVEIGLQRPDSLSEVVAQLGPSELVEDSAVAALDEAVCARRADLGAAVFDAGEVEMELAGMVLGAAELAAIVGQHRTDRQVELAIERQHVVVSTATAASGCVETCRKPTA